MGAHCHASPDSRRPGLASLSSPWCAVPGHVYNFEMQMVHQITGGCGQDLKKWTERQSFSLSAAGWRSACIYL